MSIRPSMTVGASPSGPLVGSDGRPAGGGPLSRVRSDADGSTRLRLADSGRRRAGVRLERGYRHDAALTVIGPRSREVLSTLAAR